MSLPINPSPFSKYRRHGLRVTDLRDQQWCEQQLAYTLRYGRETTEVMKKGSQRHQELQEELVEVIPVKPRSQEDYWALYMHNASVCLSLLRDKGICRELPVFGKINDTWIIGVIDQIDRLDNGSLLLSDTKTRNKKNMPSEAQKRTTRLQMMLYRKLFHQMTKEFPLQEFYQQKNLDPEKELSSSFLEDLKLNPNQNENLSKVMQSTLQEFQSSGKLASSLLVRYEWQTDKSEIGTDKFPYQESWLKRRITESLQFWNGDRTAKGVQRKDNWKCRFCSFSEDCGWKQRGWIS